MTISEIALSQIGIKEIVGSEHNPEVLKYFQEIGHDWVKNDEMAWCSAFVNWCVKKSNREFSGQLNARSWLTMGSGVTEPQTGDIVILWREDPNSWKGHVGIFCRQTKTHIFILGGNQANSVCVKAYPRKQLLEYRRL